MKLSSICIRRPVLTFVLNIVLVLAGAVALMNLGVRDYPAVDSPIITVSTNYSGAAPEVIDNLVTTPLEQSINGISGIRSITSSSTTGSSNITVEFNLGYDLEVAANDVRDRVSRAMKSLPTDISMPVVTKSDANASPIVMASVISKKMSPFDLSDFCNNELVQRFQTIDGVSQVAVYGDSRRSMRLWLDPLRMSALGVTAQDIQQTLLKENIELPAGSVEDHRNEISVLTRTGYSVAEDFNEMIIRTENGAAVKLKDVAEAVEGPERDKNIFRCNGVQMVGLAVIPQPGANEVAIADEFYKRLKAVNRDFGNEISLNVILDITKNIRDSIRDVLTTIFLSFILVVVVIFFFLRTWRATLIPVLAMPISLLATFAVLYVFGFSVNILTLLGIVLGTGLVVDDAIVMLENIYSKIEDGLPPMEAGDKGATEIFFAIIATTLSLAAVITPLMFMQGMTGRLFREFAAVMASTALLSALVSLTLTPMLSSRILRKHKKNENSFQARTEPFFDAMINGYTKALTAVIEHRFVAIAVMAVSFVIIGIIYSVLPQELAPMEDRSRFSVNVNVAENSSFAYLVDRLNVVSNIVDKMTTDDRTSFIVRAGSATSGAVRVYLKDPDKRSHSQDEIAQNLTRALSKVPGVRASVSQEPTIGDRRAGLPIQYIITTSEFDSIRTIVPKIFRDVASDSVLVTPDVNLKFSSPQIAVTLDREKARSLGVSATDAAGALNLMLSGQLFDYYVHGNQQYSVLGELSPEARNSPSDIGMIPVRTSSGTLIPVDNVISWTERAVPPQLFHYNRLPAATFSAGLTPGKTIGQGIDEMNAIVAKTGGVATYLAGPARDFAESSSNLLFTFFFALLLVYLVLSAQFESFRHPLIVMMTVPLAIAGALIALALFGQTINVFCQIGMVMLVGLVAKNGILIVEFANQRREAGIDTKTAVIGAAASRFRPILMTSLTVILGSLPIALAIGSSGQSRISLGIAVIGGMLFSLALSLFIVPSIYLMLNRKK